MGHLCPQNIMLVDDDKTTNFLNQRLLKRYGNGITTVIANNGRDAIDYLQGLAAKGDRQSIPELIFLDLKMPLMDGWQFMEAFQQLPAFIRNHAKVIVLTTSLYNVDRERAASTQGVEFFAEKPLTSHKLEEFFTHLFPPL